MDFITFIISNLDRQQMKEDMIEMYRNRSNKYLCAYSLEKKTERAKCGPVMETPHRWWRWILRNRKERCEKKESYCSCQRLRHINGPFPQTHTSWQATSSVNMNSCFTCFCHIHQETHLCQSEYLLTWLSCLLKCFKQITWAVILISSTGCTSWMDNW